MKNLKLTEESLNILNLITHHALKGVGIEALKSVKALESWLATATDEHPESK